MENGLGRMNGSLTSKLTGGKSAGEIGAKKKRGRPKGTTKSKKYCFAQQKKPVDEDNSDIEGEYVVERIVSKRFNQGRNRVEYLIKWYGWPDSANTWEPTKNLTSCQWMIRKYEENTGSSSVKVDGDEDEVDGFKSLEELKAEKESSVLESLGYTTVARKAQKDYLEKMIAKEAKMEKDLFDGVLDKCPVGKEVQTIHGVTVVHGYLTFLVEWKSDNPAEVPLPATPDEFLPGGSSNMVLALSMNTKFPQEVIRFYQSHVNLLDCQRPVEAEKISAVKALELAKARHKTLRRELVDLLDNEDEDDDSLDEATEAIERESRQQHKYSTEISDTDEDSDDEQFFDEIDLQVE